MFPVALVKPRILSTCPPGGLVLDPFAGSGTVGQAVQELGEGRRYCLIEINPEYVEMARRRTRQPALL